MFPLRLDAVECYDDKGNKSFGYGAFAMVDTPSGALMAKYPSFSIPASVAERLREYGKAAHLKTPGPSKSTIYHGARLQNGIYDISYATEYNEVNVYRSISKLPKAD